MTDNRCVCCGEIIPEGRLVCPACEQGKKEELNVPVIDEETFLRMLGE